MELHVHDQRNILTNGGDYLSNYCLNFLSLVFRLKNQTYPLSLETALHFLLFVNSQLFDEKHNIKKVV